MRDADLILPEGYDRNKRAALAYSGLLIASVVATATPQWLGLAAHTDVAKILLWSAAIYYVGRFYLDWRVAARTNSKLIRNDVGISISTRLKELDAQFQTMQQTTCSHIENLSKAKEDAVANLKNHEFNDSPGIKAAIEAFDSWVRQQRSPGRERMLGITTPLDTPERLGQLESKLLEARDRNFTIVTQAATNGTDGLLRAAELLQTTATENLSVLTGLRADFHELGSTFNIEQRIMFYILDLGAVIGLFAFASIVAFSSLLSIIVRCSTAQYI